MATKHLTNPSPTRENGIAVTGQHLGWRCCFLAICYFLGWGNSGTLGLLGPMAMITCPSGIDGSPKNCAENIGPVHMPIAPESVDSGEGGFAPTSLLLPPKAMPSRSAVLLTNSDTGAGPNSGSLSCFEPKGLISTLHPAPLGPSASLNCKAKKCGSSSLPDSYQISTEIFGWPFNRLTRRLLSRRRPLTLFPIQFRYCCAADNPWLIASAFLPTASAFLLASPADMLAASADPCAFSADDAALPASCSSSNARYSLTPRIRMSRFSIRLAVWSSPHKPQTTNPTLANSRKNFMRLGRSGNFILKCVAANFQSLRSSRWSIPRKTISQKTPTMTRPVYTAEYKSNEARIVSRLAKMQSKIESSIRVRNIQANVVLSIYAVFGLYFIVQFFRGRL